MSDAVVTPTEGAVVTIDPANSSAQAPAPAPKAGQDPNAEPAWLAPRLERERAKVLKDLGVDSPEEAKKAVEAARAAAEAQKSDAQKRGELESTLKAERAAKQELAQALDAYAKSQMGALTEAQRNAVAAVAGEDPAKQLKTIDALRPTWASAPAAPPPPKDTAPAPAAPKEGASSAPPDAKAIYEELKTNNPVLASRYALANGIFDK